MSSQYEIITSNNKNILFDVDSNGEVSIGGLSLVNPEFSSITLSNGSMSVDISGNMDMSGNLVVNGDLTVRGTRSEILTTNTSIKDSIIELSYGTTDPPINDIGFIFNRGYNSSNNSSRNACIYWKEGDDSFIMGLTTHDATVVSTLSSVTSFLSVSGTNIKIGDLNTNAHLTTNGTGNLLIDTNNSLNSGSINLANGVNGDIEIKTNGTGNITLETSTINIGKSDNTTLLFKTPGKKKVQFQDTSSNSSLIIDLTTIGSGNINLKFADAANKTFIFPDIAVSSATIITTENLTDIANIEFQTIKVKGLAVFEDAVYLGDDRDDNIIVRGILKFTNPSLSNSDVNGCLLWDPTNPRLIYLPDASGNIIIDNIDTDTCDISSNIINFGTSSNTDITLNFLANDSSGLIKWMEDEDYFQFNDDILMNTSEKIIFRNSDLYIYSSASGKLDIFSDTSDGTITIAATNIDLSSSGNMGFGSDSVSFGSGSGVDTSLTFKGGSNDGVFTWIETNDSFRFMDDISMNTREKILFGDTDLYIHSSAPSILDIVGPTTNITATTYLDIVAGNIDIFGTSTIGIDSSGTMSITSGNTLGITATSGQTTINCNGQTLDIDATTIYINSTGATCIAAATNLKLGGGGEGDIIIIDSNKDVTVKNGSKFITNNVDISGGAIDNVIIGYNISNLGAFTDLSATTINILTNLDVSGTANIHAQLDISGRTGSTNGKINAVDIGYDLSGKGAFTDLSATNLNSVNIGYDLSGKGAFTDLSATDLATTTITILSSLDVSGTANIHAQLDISGRTGSINGKINAVDIGYDLSGKGAFTDLSAQNISLYTVMHEGSSYGYDIVLDTSNNNKLQPVTSDRRLKENIVPLSSGLEDILKLNPVSYNWKSNNRNDIGFIAQDIRETFPIAAIGNDNNENNYMSYNHRPILAKAVKAIQELSGENTKLKEENQEIKEKLDTLISKLQTLGII